MSKFFMKKRKKLHPLMTYIIFILAIIVISGFLQLLDTQSTFYKVNEITLNITPSTEVVKSLFSLSGIKYIFANTVSNFANFTVLSNLIILLMGFSIMDRSGFLQTVITLTTKKMKKNAVTFIFVFLCILSSIFGDLSYLIFIPLGASLFYYGKRNPALGIISSFAALTLGRGLNFFLTSTDSSLINYTKLAAKTVNSTLAINVSYVFIMFSAILILSFIITSITENRIADRLPHYDFTEQELEEDIVTKSERKGIKYALIAAGIYLLIFIYNIIPNLPLGGNLLDYTQKAYIDKLFSVNSFFSNGFVFIVTILFIILGLFYGIGAKTIKNHRDFFDSFGHSLDGIGDMLVMIFLASTFISIYKYSNIGNVVVSFIGNIISSLNFAGVPLIILVFILVMVANLFVPSSELKWYMLSGTIVPTMMNSEMTPAFAQLVFRFAESASTNLTPVLAYFIVYLAFLQKYNQKEERIRLSEAIKYQIPYTTIATISFVVILILWYLISLPLGINCFPTI